MAFQGGLYLSDDLATHAQKRAKAAFAGKLNTYIGHLVRQDRDGGGALENFSAGELAAWLAADRAILEAAPQALSVLHSPDAATREAAAKALALQIISAALRRSPEAEPREEPRAAEAATPVEPAPGAATPPARTAAREKADRKAAGEAEEQKIDRMIAAELKRRDKSATPAAKRAGSA